jgi:hypothetical protein
MQRTGHDKVHGRGQSPTVNDQVLLAGVPIGQRAVADAGRWAALGFLRFEWLRGYVVL